MVINALRTDVQMLAESIGERNMGRPRQLARAADWLAASLEGAGYPVSRLGFQVDGLTVENIEATLPGTAHADEVLIVGAHYDTVPGTPGADDNATGVAALLAIARALAGTKPKRTIRFVGFVNEEPPYFHTDAMGSYVYAQACRARGDRIVGMIALESIGYYTDAPGSQTFPVPQLAGLYPDRGNFLALVGNASSSAFLNQATEAFSGASPFPVEAVAMPDDTRGVGWSDHWSFWQAGYPALMATDTAPFRNPHYHEPTDRVSTLDFPALAEVTRGFIGAIERLASRPN